MVEATNPTSPTPSIANGAPPKSPSSHRPNGSEADAQEMVISSLRAQIQDLFSQVTQLNGKLVKSYDRVSDLEDDVHVASQQARQSTLKISQLELERTQHLSALNTGLLVEKSHVTAELTRLMEKATEEAAQRGQAESAKADIEKDLDDLSATLFAQANTMVAEARYAQSLMERKVEQTEEALKGAEEMVGIMQQQMQALQLAKDDAETKTRDMQAVMGKGKWVDRRSGSSGSTLAKETRLLSSHLPYQEFLLFVAHLRSIHPSSMTPPAITTLLPMAFLARLSSEDSEPTVRLDLAPSLNWLSRRSVLAAIHTGQLTIEPMSSGTLLAESSSSTNSNIPGLNSSSNNISCALCGTPIFSTPDNPHTHQRPPTHPAMNNHSPNNSWSASLKKTLSYSTVNGGSPTPPPRSMARPTALTMHDHSAPYPPQIYIFRIAMPLPPPQPMNPPTRTSSPSPFLPSVGSSKPAVTSTPPPPPNNSALGNLSLNSLTQSSGTQSTIYPLCTSGWCLARLRMTCSLWAFVRTGIVERVWEEEIPTILPVPAPSSQGGAPPPVPPRRRGLWSMASKLGERAVSWSGDGSKEKEKKVEDKVLPTPPPPPPPVHPVLATPSRPTTPAPAPPLPKRSEGRARRGSVAVSMPMPPPPLPPRDVHRLDSSSNTPTPLATPAVELPNPHPEPNVLSVAIPEEAEPQPEPAPVSPVKAIKAEEVKAKRFSAHQVPLPDSRPGTPASPAEIHHVVPAATAGTAPPPLPRRAAARRPVPPPPEVPAAAVAVSVPATVAEEPVVALPAVVEEPVVALPAVAEESVVVPPAAEESVVAPLVSAEEPTVATAEEPTPALPAEESPKGDDNGAEEAKPEPETTGEDVLFSETEELERAEGPQDEKTITMTDSPRVDSPVPKEVPSDNEEKVEEKKAEDEEGHEAYVGEVTWEERTWKELVRLREEMFWARIGALRA
ncbi:proline-rich protein [Roridomyces roridus]|uniref:Proline-rich protein n=1 Tax=Roridomyces roridus TaxID=1738132 RepID=A0AAD7BZ04_9AGAR|nr:proline-rich protein [Roridomyces roridus]